MQHGYFSVKNILDYVTDYPELLPRTQMKTTGRGFIDSYRSLLKNVPQIPGWYAWLKLENNQVSFIYIGKSSKRKTSDIRARLEEEFYDDRVIFWATVHEEIRNKDWSDHKYYTHIKRALRKVGIH